MAAPKPDLDVCERCAKPRTICICDRIQAALPHRTEVVILQHPQEGHEPLGTARITELALAHARVRVGLSWPSLDAAVGRKADVARWGVLYPGSLKKPLTVAQLAAPLVILERAGNEVDLRSVRLEGFIVLDGTWSQAKTLWWRNAWLLRLHRIVLHPREPSAYGKLREQSRREHVSTIEAVAETLEGLGEAPEIRNQLKSLFRSMLQRARDAHREPERSKPKPHRAGGRSRGGGPLD